MAGTDAAARPVRAVDAEVGRPSARRGLSAGAARRGGAQERLAVGRVRGVSPSADDPAGAGPLTWDAEAVHDDPFAPLRAGSAGVHCRASGRRRGRAGGRRDGIPQEFRTKPQLALEMIERALEAGVPTRWIVADEVYGKLRRALEGPSLRRPVHFEKGGCDASTRPRHK
jgi:hypothetical protein